MTQYIDKSALVAELKKQFDYRVNSLKAINNGTFWDKDQSEDEFNTVLTRCAYDAAKNEIFELMCFIDTLEVKEVPIWEKVSPDTGQTTLYKDEDKSYLERFGYRIDLKELDKLPKKNLKAQKGEEV